VLNIISALSSLHYTLAASIPLQPISAGRDILLFASQPDTGVAAKDAYKPKVQSTSPIGSDGTESPVLVQRTSSFPVPTDPPSREDPRTVDPERRVLPWTSTVHGQDTEQPLSERPNVTSSRSPSAQAKIQQHRRNASLNSSQPVVKPQSSSVQSSPRPRNVLLKKTSLRREVSNSSPSQAQSQAPKAPRSRRASDSTAGVNTRRDEPGRRHITADGGRNSTQAGGDVGSWMMVDPPAKVGHMGLTMYTDPSSERQTTVDQDIRQQGPEHHHIPAPQITALVAEGRSSQDGHSSGESIYETPSANLLPKTSGNRELPRLPPRPQQPYIAPVPQYQHQSQQLNTTTLPLPLGSPIAGDEVSQVSSIPAYLPLKQPQSPNRVNQAERVDIGIPSVHGSLGYMPSMMSFAPSTHDPMPPANDHDHSRHHTNGTERRGDFDPNDQERYDDSLSHMPGGLNAGEDRKGKGKEGARRVWDEERGVWVEGITPKSVRPDGPGSARTRVSIN
jgi:hypothetical protein